VATHAFPDGHLPPVRLASLPEAVRALVVARAAEVLPLVATLPPSLRRVAAFAPARRARLGGPAIGSALEDDDLRQHVGTQVAARPARTEDPGERAARAWLVRADGWEAEVAEALALLAKQDDTEAGPRQPDLERLRRKVAAAEQAAREARAKARAQVEEYKQENATLRHKLGEARSAERGARASAEESAQAADAARARTEALEAAQDKEVRRLRDRVDRLEGEQVARRRTSREEKDDATLRARLLLDTVIDAATGLRRELGLRAVPGAPADRVEAGLAEAEAARPCSSRSWACHAPGSSSTATTSASWPGRSCRWSSSANGCCVTWPPSSPAPAPRRPWSSTPTVPRRDRWSRPRAG
jgi:hypothetical protein